jgi:hypothetical protein
MAHHSSQKALLITEVSIAALCVCVCVCVLRILLYEFFVLLDITYLPHDATVLCACSYCVRLNGYSEVTLSACRNISGSAQKSLVQCDLRY